MRLYELQKAKEILQIAKGTVLMAEYKMQFRDGFLDRTKQMSGLKTDEAFAGAIGVSESVLARAKKPTNAHHSCS
jgi:hypothetical protein